MLIETILRQQKNWNSYDFTAFLHFSKTSSSESQLYQYVYKKVADIFQNQIAYTESNFCD